MINQGSIKEFLNCPLDFHLINAFEEVADYGRHFVLPFNVLAYRKKPDVCSGHKEWGYILNKATGERYDMQPDEIHFIPYGLPIFIRNVPNTIGYSLHFTLEQYPGADLFRGERRIIRLSGVSDQTDFEAVFREKDPLRSYCLAESLVFRLCAEILPAEPGNTPWRFAALLHEVRQEIDARWNVELLARKAGMSTGAFSREFSAHMECTAKDFLQNELLQKALLLLRKPGATVQNTAARLHFSSPFYFSKFFKRRYGIAPQEYIHRYSLPPV